MCSMPWKAIHPVMSTRSGNGIQGVPFKNAQGEPDVLPLGELEAVERSGRSIFGEYAMKPSQWPVAQVAVIPLMEGRPGATVPHPSFFELIGDGNKRWTITEIEVLLRQADEPDHSWAIIASRHKRSLSSVKTMGYKVSELIRVSRLKWDGVHLTRGPKATVYQWPIGYRNQPKQPWQ